MPVPLLLEFLTSMVMMTMMMTIMTTTTMAGMTDGADDNEL